MSSGVMKLNLTDMTNLRWSGRSNEGGQTITLNCRMDHRDMEDTIAQICEQMGDEVFMDFVTRMMS